MSGFGATPNQSAVARLFKPLEAFFRIEAASGLVLLASAVLALALANSPLRDAYEQLWHASFTFGAQSVSLHFVINEVLMTLFFFVVGLEIRREAQDGSLSDFRTAMLPIVAALGGVIVPALIYLALNTEPDVRSGWAIPIATDIAFAVGVMTLLGKRVPTALRVLLLALAIADDLVAILVIALFYADPLGVAGLSIAAAGVVAVFALQRLGVRSPYVYVFPGAVVWYGLFVAGVHPVLAGVILGLMTPMGSSNAGATPPAERIEAALHPYVAYGVMPLFAFANAGVSIAGITHDASNSLLIAGIVVGLVIGKPLGITTAVLLAVKTGLCRLPADVRWNGIVLVGLLGGIGFTMSVFIATLAFPESAFLASAKAATLFASALAALLALTFGRLAFALPRSTLT